MANSDPFDVDPRHHPEWEFIPDPKGPLGARKRNPYYHPHKANPHVAAHKGQRVTEHKIRELVRKQHGMRPKVKPLGVVHIPAHSSGQATNVDWIASYQRYTTGHVSIQPYSGEGVDFALRVAQGMKEYAEEHQFAIGRIYEVFLEGIGVFFFRFVTGMAALIDSLERADRGPSKLMELLERLIRESDRLYIESYGGTYRP